MLTISRNPVFRTTTDWEFLPKRGSIDWKKLQKASSGQRTSATAPYSRIYQEQRRLRQAWRLELNKSLAAAENALNQALIIARKIADRKAESSVLNWRSRLQRVRTQLTLNGEQTSYRTQRSIVTDIQNSIAR